MKILVAVVVLAALALAGSRRALRPQGRFIALPTFLTGTEFILIGLALGSSFLNLIDGNALDRMRPFVCVALGWIGFLFGLQFDRRTVQRLPAGFLRIAATEGLITMGMVLPVIWLLVAARGDVSAAMLVLAVATLAATAACTGQTSLAVIDSSQTPRSPQVMTLLRLVSSLDPAVGVITFGVALTLFAPHPFSASPIPLPLQWLAISICLGFLTAWIFVSLTLTRTSPSELVLYFLGAIALSSGIALGFRLSALFVSFVCGLVVANMAHVRSIRGRVMELLVGGERFLYLVLLVLAGATMSLPTTWTLGLSVAYVAARLTGKVTGGYLATRGLAREQHIPGSVGLGLVSQGGMPLGIVIDYWLVVDDPVSEVVVSVAVVGIVLSELLGPWLAIGVVRQPGPKTP